MSFAVTFQVATRAQVAGLSTETNGLVRELQNCSQRAQSDEAVKDRLQECALPVFRAHEQGVDGFKRGVDLISDVLPFGRLRYGEPDAVSNAIGYAKFSSRSHDAVVRVFDEAGNVIETRDP